MAPESGVAQEFFGRLQVGVNLRLCHIVSGQQGARFFQFVFKEGLVLTIQGFVAGSVRRLVFHLASSYPYQSAFRAIFARVMSLPVPSIETG